MESSQCLSERRLAVSPGRALDQYTLEKREAIPVTENRDQTPQTTVFRVCGTIAIGLSLVGLGHSTGVYLLSDTAVSILKGATVTTGFTAVVSGLTDLQQKL